MERQDCVVTVVLIRSDVRISRVLSNVGETVTSFKTLGHLTM